MESAEFIKKTSKFLHSSQVLEIMAKGTPDLIIINPREMAQQEYENIIDLLENYMDIEYCESYQHNTKLSFFWDVRTINSLWN